MRVGDVMTRRVKAVREDEDTEQAAAVLRRGRIRHLPVVDAEGRLVGIVTPGDLLAAAHPATRARRLASEVMTRRVQTARADEELEAAAERMRQAGVHCLPVVDAAGHVVGMLTDVDVLATVTRARPPEPPFVASVPVDAVMTPHPVTIEADASLADAAEALLQGGFRHLPVVDDAGRLVGMLSERDLRTHLAVDVEGFWDATLESLSEPVSEVMTPDPLFLRSRTPLSAALESLAFDRVGALPVLDQADRPVGILSYVDVLLWLRRSAEEERERAP